MARAASPTQSRLEPHRRLTVVPGTSTGKPASSPATTQAKLVPISFNNAGLNDIAKFLNEQIDLMLLLRMATRDDKVDVAD